MEHFPLVLGSSVADPCAAKHRGSAQIAAKNSYMQQRSSGRLDQRDGDPRSAPKTLPGRANRISYQLVGVSCHRKESRG